jgi:hypothetical protein
MRVILPLLILLTAAGVSMLEAQVDYFARFGVTYATALIEDRIVNDPIEVRQRLAPTLALGAALPIAPRYRAGLEATLTTSGYRSTEDGTDADLGTLRTGSIALGLDGPVAFQVRWRAGVGLIRYWPSEDRGIFLQGGTTRFLAGAGVDYRRPVSTKWELMASLRYDIHRFTTDELQARGFGQNQGVQRISASLGIARGGP